MSNLSFKEKRELQGIVSKSLVSLKSGALTFKEKRVAQKSLSDALQRLGAGISKAENAFVVFLRQVVTGTKDNLGLGPLLAQIDEAITGLNGGGLLVGEAEEVADKAITHWAELEERQAA
jgi:hypothetical protein